LLKAYTVIGAPLSLGEHVARETEVLAQESIMVARVHRQAVLQRRVLAGMPAVTMAGTFLARLTVSASGRADAQRRIALTKQAAPARVKLSRETEAGAVKEQPAEGSGMGRRNKNVSAFWGCPPPENPLETCISAPPPALRNLGLRVGSSKQLLA
jgi:hypothetical protein